AGGFLGFASPKSEESAEDRDYQRTQDIVLPALHEMFRPEFLNRVDDIILFHRLTRAEVRQILDIMLAQTGARLREQMITMRITEAAKDLLAQQGYSNEFGARALRRVVTRILEDKLAESYLRGSIRQGDTVLVDVTHDQSLMVRQAPKVTVM